MAPSKEDMCHNTFDEMCRIRQLNALQANFLAIIYGMLVA
jgi:hypothetical protein